MQVIEVQAEAIADLPVTLTPKKNILETIKNFAGNLLDKASSMLQKAKELLVNEAKSGNITALKLAAAGAAGFVVGFLFGAAETTLR
jgi:hypothetical protein